MSNSTLMQRMLDAGVNISNMQEVYEFFHNLGNGGTGGGLTENEVMLMINTAISGMATNAMIQQLEQQIILMNEDVEARALLVDFQTLISNVQSISAVLGQKASQNALDQLNASKAPVADLEALRSVSATRDELQALDSQKSNKADVESQLNAKLNRSEFQQHFRGLFSSEELLASGVIDPKAGDYANVDAGVGNPTKMYAYDVDDGIWQEQGSSGLTVSSTDSVPEGNSNLYFTAARVVAALNALSTTDLPEGQNLYFTAARVATAVRALTTADLPESPTRMYYTDERVLAVVNPILGDIETALNEILG
ncbi:hypothetical protein [Acinetobacter sp. ANC 3813]|uniref:hypothetical protein n=1 Tax=Acinetobacter sp. ANC 3813 TaxID=1977873 RepID=UPI000A32F17E|nr:hypothetical protein [Acinetobacter sp. ANC 3813]OTG87892.1 hypothetical protein B9T34_16285 [Acinetobacter sp. ANC 3813]